MADRSDETRRSERNLLRQKRGSVTAMIAVTIVMLIGFVALGYEVGYAMFKHRQMQSAADAAATAGARAASNSQSATPEADAVAATFGFTNGVGGATVTVNNPPNSGSHANDPTYVEVIVSQPQTLPLSTFIMGQSSRQWNISARALAKYVAGSGGCLAAINPDGTGLIVNGGASLNAANCTVSSNNAVTVSGGSTVTTPTVDYATSYTITGGSSIIPPPGKTSVTYTKTTTADTLAANAEVTGATARLGQIPVTPYPTAPTVPAGRDLTFGYSMSGTLPNSCTTPSHNTNWVITCVGTGPFNFGAITISGGASVTVSNTSSAATYNFSGVINASSSAGLTFNGGTGAIYNMENGLVTGGSAPVTFSAGTFHMGTNTNCGAGYSICASATMTIAGPSTFALVGGIYNGGGSTLALGTINNSCAGSTSNSYNIGAAANGNSINIGGGAITTLCDASGAGDLFQTAGSIVSGSGGVVTLPAAAEHDINGNMSLSGNVTFGAGVYTVVGYVSLGQGITVNGNGVTFVLGGANACATGMALCVASGVAGTLTAPSSGAAPALTGLRLFAVVALGLLTFIATSLAPLFAPSRTLSMLFGMAGGVIGYFVPTMVIHRLVKKHAKAVVAGLPDALELMVICVEAGIAFEDGIDRVAAELRNTQPALAEELALTSADLKILPSRDQALANLAERIDMPSVRSVATTLSQTLRYGTPLTQALRVVAAELRNDTLVRLEERANQLPTLMTIPMMLFILPTLFIIVAGPAALRVIDTFFR